MKYANAQSFRQAINDHLANQARNQSVMTHSEYGEWSQRVRKEG